MSRIRPDAAHRGVLDAMAAGGRLVAAPPAGRGPQPGGRLLSIPEAGHRASPIPGAAPAFPGAGPEGREIHAGPTGALGNTAPPRPRPGSPASGDPTPEEEVAA